MVTTSQDDRKEKNPIPSKRFITQPAPQSLWNPTRFPKQMRACTQTVKRILPTTIEVIYNSRQIRPQSDHEMSSFYQTSPSHLSLCSNMLASLPPPRPLRTAVPGQGPVLDSFQLFHAFCFENYNISGSGYPARFHRMLQFALQAQCRGDH